MKYEIASNCIRGNFRDNNEDAIAYGQHELADFCWMVIADGMGGHQAGEIASGMVIDGTRQAIEALKIDQANDFHEKIDWQEWIRTVLDDINRKVYETAKACEEKQGMGTTGVLLVCCQQHYFVGWVGDSRAYVLRGDKITQLTKDHSAVQMLLDKGAITEEEAQRSNTKHLLARAIGNKHNVKVDVKSGTLQSQDVLFLSTDGVHDVMKRAILAEFLIQFRAGKDVTENLTQKALTLGSKDNISFGMLKRSKIQES